MEMKNRKLATEIAEERQLPWVYIISLLIPSNQN